LRPLSQKEWERPFKELKDSVEKSLDGFQNVTGEISSHLSELDRRLSQSSGSQRGEGEVPLYKCKGPNCGFTTDDIGTLLEHRDEHLLKKVEGLLHSAEPEPVEPKPQPRKHKTAKEFLDCPDCSPAFLREIESRGYAKQEPKPEKKRRFP